MASVFGVFVLSPTLSNRLVPRRQQDVVRIKPGEQLLHVVEAKPPHHQLPLPFPHDCINHEVKERWGYLGSRPV